jgi:RHS repeat-associated protein
MTESLPLILSDETNNYIYGPGGIPVEQISSGGTTTYLHHDQQGSTRLLTGSTGTVTGSITFDAYGNKTGSTGTTTTPLGYDGQYTSSDTGLIYLRARVYDPATAQFLSVDPLRAITRAPYTYVKDNPLNLKDNPLNLVDPSGLAWQVCVGGTVSFGFFTVEGNACYVNTPGGEGLVLPPYAVYAGSYELAKGINELGEKLGPVGSDISHVVGAPLVLPQAVGLGLDVLGDKFKNFLFGHESVCDEGREEYLNPLHSFLPPFLRGPKTYLPGIHANGKIDIEW